MEQDVNMKSGTVVPTLFYDAVQDIAAVGHGDDLLFEAPEGLQFTRDNMTKVKYGQHLL